MAAVRLYPTLSSFYKDQNIGFGSELDNQNIILWGVPEERLYRKNIGKEHHMHQHGDQSDIDNAQIHTESRHQTEELSREVRPLYPSLPTNDLNNKSTLDNEMQETTLHHSRRAEPSAPPMDILGEDILRFLEDVLAEQQNLQSSQNEDPGTPTRDYSTLNIPTNIVLDDSWIDDLQPDYDITVEDIAADVLNNLNVEHARDTKTHKEKSFVLGDNLASSKDQYAVLKQSKTRGHLPTKDLAKQHHKRHNHDINGNNISASAGHQHQHQHEKIHLKHHHRHHTPPQRNTRSPTRKDTRPQADNNRHLHATNNAGHPYPNKDRPTHISNDAHQHRTHHVHTKAHKETHGVSKDAHRNVSGRNEQNHITTDAHGNRPDHHGNKAERRHATKRDAEREKENVSSPVEMSMRPEGPVNPGSPEYKDWMKWRKQVNRQLATVILLRRGDQVHVQRHDMTRKPLNQKSIDFVSQIARSGNITSLGGKPYVMYGIPRATLSGSQGDLMY